MFLATRAEMMQHVPHRAADQAILDEEMWKGLPLAFGVVLNFLCSALNAEDVTMTEA
jgi:hypothetical protein